MNVNDLIQLENDNLDLLELKHYRTIPAYQQAKTLFTNTPRKYHYDAMEKFHDFMLDHGFRRLGEGSFAAVYEKLGYPWVFKIFHGDPAYLDFVKVAMADQSNPHFPRFKGQLFRITSDTYAVRTEKLSHIFSNIRDLLNLTDRWKGDKLTAQQEEYLTDVHMPKMVPALNALSELAKAHGYKLDIHAGNVMDRNGTMVLVDPIVDYAALHGNN